MVSASADEVDQLLSLEIGADDYITKPFSPRDLKARVGAMLRRPRSWRGPVPSLEGDAAAENVPGGAGADGEVAARPRAPACVGA